MRAETSSIRRCRYLQAKEAPSWCLRTDRRSPPTWTCRRANTTRLWEVGRGSTFLVVAAYRKARVVGPAYRRRCPRFFSSFWRRNRQRIKDFGSDSEAVLVASVPQNFAEIVEDVAGHVEMLKR
jgi:hypothetical protein